MIQECLNISLLQFDIVLNDVQANLHKIDMLIENKLKDIDLFILPEMFHCGFATDPIIVAQTMDGEVVQWMKNTSEKYQVCTIGSVVIVDKGLYFNRLICAFPNGDLQFNDKRHLFRMGNEDKHYTQGNDKLIIDYKGWRIRPLICYDLRFPVWSRNQNDYDLLIYVANWPRARQKIWEVLLTARAIENQCFVAGVNRVGFDGANNYTGGSVLLDYKGQTISSCTSDVESLVSGFIDYNHLREFKVAFPSYMDADEFKVI